MALLELRGVTKVFGGIRALHGVSFEVRQGEIVGLIGPNGAGKTTLFNVTSGVYKPTQGKVLLRGEDISGLRPFRIAEFGLTRTYQETNLFHEFSVEENILIGCHLKPRIGLVEEIFGTSSANRRMRETQDKIDGILKMLGLSIVRNELAKNLPHGYQRTLGVAIGLATEPAILLLDEPFSGMNAEEKREMMSHITKIHDENGVSILLVEHDMKAVMGLCERIVVLNFGEKIAEGTPEEIRENADVVEAYLGVEENAA